MKKLAIRGLIGIALCLSPLLMASAFAQGEGAIPDGTVINMQNWEQYKQYIPGGMQEFFKGTYFWKLPSDFQLVVGPTHHYEPPKTFLDYTAKYSGQVKIENEADGK